MLTGDKKYMIPSPLSYHSLRWCLTQRTEEELQSTSELMSTVQPSRSGFKYNCQDLKQTSPRGKTQTTHILLNAAERRPERYWGLSLLKYFTHLNFSTYALITKREYTVEEQAWNSSKMTFVNFRTENTPFIVEVRDFQNIMAKIQDNYQTRASWIKVCMPIFKWLYISNRGSGFCLFFSLGHDWSSLKEQSHSISREKKQISPPTPIWRITIHSTAGSINSIFFVLPKLLQDPLGDKQSSLATSTITFQGKLPQDAKSFSSFTNCHNYASGPGTGEELLGCERHMVFWGLAVERVDHSNTHPDSQRTATGQRTAHVVSFK